MTNEDLTGNHIMGGLIGASSGPLSLVDDHVTATIAGYYNLGGLVGDMESDGSGDISIDSSSATVSMNSGNTNEANDWGGLVGYSYAQGDNLSITNSTANLTGSQYDDGSEMGGIVGESDTYDGGTTTISNNTVTGAIQSYRQNGGIVGLIYTSWEDANQPTVTLDNDTTSMSVSGGTQDGGIVGEVQNYDGIVSLWHVSNTGAVSNDDDDGVGGIIGQVDGDNYSDSGYVSIDQSFATGDVTGDGVNEVGGLVGTVDTVPLNISNSYSNQAVDGNAETGGIIGYADSATTIINSYAAGTVNGSVDVGGVAGYLGSDGSIVNAFTSAAITSIDPTTTGGIVGTSDTYDIQAALDVNAAGISNCFGNMQNGEMCLPVDTDGSQQDVFMGSDSVNNYPLNQWDFEGTWITQPGQLPQLQWSYTATPPSVIDISTCQQLQDMNNDVTADYALTQNIDCSMTNPGNDNFDPNGTWGDGNGFIPIGFNNEGGFLGSFEGNDYTISGLYINQGYDSAGVGLFSAASGNATVQDVHLTDGTVLGGIYVGGLVGFVDGPELVNDSSSLNIFGDTNVGGLVGGADSILIAGSSTSGNVSALSDNAGGIIGYVQSTLITDDYSTATVMGDNQVGGLVGLLDGNGEIEDTYAHGDVSAGGDNAGGLVGRLNDATIDSSYASGDVVGNDVAGGLVGYNDDQAVINNSFSAGAASAIDSTSTQANSFIGYDDGNGFNLTNDFFNSDGNSGYCSDGQIDYVINDQCTGLSLNDSPSAFYNQANDPMNTWDFNGTWAAHSYTYPTLTDVSNDGSPQIECNETNPGDTSVVVGCTSTPLTWGATTWVMQYRPLSSSTWIPVTLNNPSVADATITDLTPGTDYVVEFQFTNDWGTSQWGHISFTTTGTAPVVTPPITTTPTTTTPATTPTATPSSSPLTLSSLTSAITPITTATTPAEIILNDFSNYTGAGHTVNGITVGEVFHFDLVKNGVTEHHTATVESIGSNSITFTIASKPFDVTVMSGQSALVSVDQDGHNDIKLTLGSINGQTAQVTFKALTATTNGSAQATAQQTDFMWLWIFLGSLLVLLLIWTQRRRHQPSLAQ